MFCLTLFGRQHSITTPFPSYKLLQPHTHTHTSARAHTCTYAHTYTHTSAHTHMHIRAHTCTHTRTHAHTHTLDIHSSTYVRTYDCMQCVRQQIGLTYVLLHLNATCKSAAHSKPQIPDFPTTCTQYKCAVRMLLLPMCGMITELCLACAG